MVEKRDDFLIPLSTLEERLVHRIEPHVDAQGYELVRVKVTGSRGQTQVCFFMDRKAGSGRIELSELEMLNGLIGDILAVLDEQEGLLRGKYVLEVSSPGIDRPLTKIAHFNQALGKQVVIKTNLDSDLPKKIRGILTQIDEKEGVFLQPSEKGQELQFIPWKHMRDAHIVYVFPQ